MQLFLVIVLCFRAITRSHIASIRTCRQLGFLFTWVSNKNPVVHMSGDCFIYNADAICNLTARKHPNEQFPSFLMTKWRHKDKDLKWSITLHMVWVTHLAIHKGKNFSVRCSFVNTSHALLCSECLSPAYHFVEYSGKWEYIIGRVAQSASPYHPP